MTKIYPIILLYYNEIDIVYGIKHLIILFGFSIFPRFNTFSFIFSNSFS